MSSAALYTPEVLALATELAAHPIDGELPLRASARSRSCGSMIEIALACDNGGRIARAGVRAHACAIGQAAAAIFIRGAIGRTAADIVAADAALAAWLSGAAAIPDWPGLDAIEKARDYPGRHGAIVLAWQAARDALSTDAQPR